MRQRQRTIDAHSHRFVGTTTDCRAAERGWNCDCCISICLYKMLTNLNPFGQLFALHGFGLSSGACPPRQTSGNVYVCFFSEIIRYTSILTHLFHNIYRRRMQNVSDNRRPADTPGRAIRIRRDIANCLMEKTYAYEMCHFVMKSS